MAKKEFNQQAFILQTLRRASYRVPARNQCLTNARIRRGFYKCAHCPDGIEHPKKNIQVDHIVPVAGPYGFISYEDYVDRLFCNVEGLQILCRDHHKVKTKAENAERSKNRKVKKKLLQTPRKKRNIKKG